MESQPERLRSYISRTRVTALDGRDRLVRFLRESELQRHVVHHGTQIARHALCESGITTRDKKTGKLKLRKVGLATAVVRPTRTLRKATSGALLITYFEAMVRQRARSRRSGRGLGPHRFEG